LEDLVARQERRESAIEFREERIPATLTANPSPPTVRDTNEHPPETIGKLAGVLRDVQGIGKLLHVQPAHDLLERSRGSLEPVCVTRCRDELAEGALERVPPDSIVGWERLGILTRKLVRIGLAHVHDGTRPAGRPGGAEHRRRVRAAAPPVSAR